MSSASPTDLVLRPATQDDADTVADVHLRSRAAAVAAGAMPPSVHDAPETRAWLAARLAVDEVWVAEVHAVEPGATVAGYLRLGDDWLNDLYVVPERAGEGIGTALLEVAKALRPGGFGLWVFETNWVARAFYARHGLVEVERTDGADNEEHAPDIRVRWRG
jgi:GNAT superfamily N-acetyltransferase